MFVAFYTVFMTCSTSFNLYDTYGSVECMYVYLKFLLTIVLNHIKLVMCSFWGNSPASEF